MRIKHLLLGVLAVAAAVACKPDEIEVTPALEVNKTSASVVAEGGDVTVEVTSNVEWTASADQDWVSINPASGKGSDKAVSVKITVDPNETEASRTAVVTVAADKLTKKVNITQAAKAGETPGPDGPKFEVTELYILGGATDNGWSLDTMEAFEKADDVWVWEGNLKPGEQFRFPLQKVSGQWWPCLVPTADGTAVVYAEDEIANEYSVAEDGKHKVTVNPVDGSLKVERIGDRETAKVTVTELYMLGGACDTGWSLDDMTAFTNNDGIFTWTGNLKAGEEFRFPLQKVSGQWWPCLMISADGTSIVYGTSDDEKVIYTVSETGNYTITIDARDFDNMTFEIVYNGPATEAPEVSWGLMGCFVDNQWVTDIPMTKEGDWIVAKGAQFTELTFKIRGNGSWNDLHNIGYAPGTEKGLVNAKLSVVTAEYSKANLGGDCVDIKLNGEPGTYDVYFSFENLEVYVMEQGYKPGEREPIQVEPQEVTYTVVGTIADHPWENNYEGGLMAADGEYLVAKNVPLVWNSTCYGGDYNRIEFKIVETGTWDGYAYPEKNVDQQANTEIQVSVGGENIALDAPEGNYDVYFDKANTKVWVMEPGLKPGGSAPADVDIDGKQWVFNWQAMGGAPCVIDLGVTQPGTGILAYDMGALDPSYAGIYYPYMVGAYSIVKTDGTSGVLTLSAEGVSVDIPYSNATENSVHFAAAVLIEEDVDCTLATTPITINLETAQGLADGEYWIIADGKVATPLTSEYGYLQVVDAVDGRSTAANAFTFTQVEDGLYTIQDSNGKFYYQTGSYDSFNIADEDGMTDEFLWEVYDTGNGQYAIINYEAGKYIQYNAAYTSYGSYMDERGTLPTLVLADNPVADEPVTPEMPEIPADYTAATLWEGSLEMAWGTGMQALAYGGYNWANCEVGQYLKVSVTPTDPSADWTVQLLYADEEYAWAGIDFLPDFKNVEEIVVELTEELLALFAAPNNGLIIQGDNATATKVELYRKPAGAAGYALTMTNATEGENWSTQVWYTLDEPLKAGAQYEFKCVAKSTVARDWCSIFLQSADGNDQNYNHGMNLSTEWTPTTLTINPDKDTYTKLTFNIGDFIGTVSLDNVSLKEVGSDVELIKNGDFENGTTAGWGSWTGAEGVGEGYAGN